ncbi:MAG: maltose alpha-D-glucosyltransferase [Kofleriaceae bacterium]
MIEDDPLWFKDAVIYEVHIRAFQDSNNDGIGDIEGLITRLDYLSDLGITAIWVLPFYPSPLRDGGYDIADYTSVHDNYGTRESFARLMEEAHRRGIRVITELVLNHTSSEHPWFQRARRAPAGSPERDFYVWSDTPNPYGDTRIIFKDYETSNWSWDPVAKQYYWHRFYSHQPDLNFDNPAVHTALFEVIDFWMAMGVDGMRLDAVPYLYEREGTSCENLPETHAFLKRLRAHIDGKFKNRMLLAEANQWPADAAQYFGDGDECHMNFHFPLMPRMFMALETEDSFPIINILKRTPKIPDSCQWATFLRNHDELTLEMVTDEDRDMMYAGYAAERAARINLGIRRRLAPLLGVRRKIELMTSLLLSLPGTPVLYYGDEIGMGDNIYLGDRDGVRTPMQWSGDRNGGFSRANPQKLYLPTIIDPEYHYEAVNVEGQQGNNASLLWWMKRTLAKRKEHPVFGRGSLEFVGSDNARVIAFVREYQGEQVLVVANLSRFVQAVRLDLQALKGMTPLELFGKIRFPEITDQPYFMSLGAYDFFWLQLEKPTVEQPSERPGLVVRSGEWTALLEPQQRAQMNRTLLQYVVNRRWFRGKARVRKNAAISEVLRVGDAAIVLFTIEYDRGNPETYVIPVAFAETESGNTIANVAIGDKSGFLIDATASDAFAQSLLQIMRGTAAGARGPALPAGAALPNGNAVGSIRGHMVEAIEGASRATATDQSNSGIIYGDRFLLKLFRVLEDGPNSELEVAQYFSRQPEQKLTAKLAGWLETPRSTLGTVFELVPNQGDAWQMTQDALDRYYDRLVADEHRPEIPPLELPIVPDRAVDWIGPVLDKLRLLGTRTADLHLALAKGEDTLFAPEPYDIMHQQSIYGSAVAHAARTFDLLRSRLRQLPPEASVLAEQVLAREAQLDKALARVTTHRIDTQRIRIHGDYHLGQVLWTGEDFVIIDFEGEPGRPITQRRFKRNALRDVAGMIRSLHYASAAALRNGKHRADDQTMLAPWAVAWAEWTAAAFTAGYLERAAGSKIIPANEADVKLLISFFLVEKCVYEIGYELSSRPDWVEIPLRGLLGLVPA